MRQIDYKLALDQLLKFAEVSFSPERDEDEYGPWEPEGLSCDGNEEWPPVGCDELLRYIEKERPDLECPR